MSPSTPITASGRLWSKRYWSRVKTPAAEWVLTSAIARVAPVITAPEFCTAQDDVIIGHPCAPRSASAHWRVIGLDQARKCADMVDAALRGDRFGALLPVLVST